MPLLSIWLKGYPVIMKEKKEPARNRFLLFISPIFIPIAIWFFIAYGFEIIMKTFFTIWDFLNLPDIFGGGGGYDPYNDFK